MNEVSNLVSSFVNKALEDFGSILLTKGNLLGKPFFYVYKESIPDEYIGEFVTLLSSTKTSRSIKLIIKGQEFKGVAKLFKTKDIPNLLVHIYTTFKNKYTVTWGTTEGTIDKVNIDLRELLIFTLVIYVKAKTMIFGISVYSSLEESNFPKYSPLTEFSIKKTLAYISILENQRAYKQFILENAKNIVEAFQEIV